jgi:hypothetical protein
MKIFFRFFFLNRVLDISHIFHFLWCKGERERERERESLLFWSIRFIGGHAMLRTFPQLLLAFLKIHHTPCRHNNAQVHTHTHTHVCACTCDGCFVLSCCPASLYSYTSQPICSGKNNSKQATLKAHIVCWRGEGGERVRVGLSTKIELQTKVVKWSDRSNYHTQLSLHLLVFDYMLLLLGGMIWELWALFNPNGSWLKVHHIGHHPMKNLFLQKFDNYF